MSLVLEKLKRQFVFNNEDDDDVKLPDPNPDMTTEEVAKFYASQYPSITTAYVSGPKIEKDVAIYTFSSKADTLG